MTELDGFLPQEAQDLINEFGKLIAVGAVADAGEADYDPDTGTAQPAQGASRPVRAIVEPYRGQRLLAGLVEASDLKVTVAALDFPDGDPTSEDVVVIDFITYSVVNVLPTYSGELKAIYELQVRRS